MVTALDKKKLEIKPLHYNHPHVLALKKESEYACSNNDKNITKSEKSNHRQV